MPLETTASRREAGIHSPTAAEHPTQTTITGHGARADEVSGARVNGDAHDFDTDPSLPLSQPGHAAHDIRLAGLLGAVSLLAFVSGWLGARANEASARQLAPPERRLPVAKDALVVAVAQAGVATAIEGAGSPDTPPPARSRWRTATTPRPRRPGYRSG